MERVQEGGGKTSLYAVGSLWALTADGVWVFVGIN